MSLRRRVALRLRAAGVPSPDADAAALIEYVSGSRSPFVELAAEQEAQLEDLVAKRCRRVPLQHLTGSAGFRYLDLEVGPGVFVPRPETEVLVDIALQEPFDRAVDLCTGSAAIALSLAMETGADVVAVERPSDAGRDGRDAGRLGERALRRWRAYGRAARAGEPVVRARIVSIRSAGSISSTA